jgi:hypothetical protein
MADFGTTYLYGPTGASANREDIMAAIFNNDPYDTPYFQLAPKGPASHVQVEWLEDSLAATSTAVRAEGQAFTQDNVVSPARQSNVTQIMGKHFIVSKTQLAVNPIGFSNAFLYEAMKASREVMRNFETSFFRSSGGSATASGTSVTGMSARAMKSFDDFLTTEKHKVSTTTLGGTDFASGTSATTLREVVFNTLIQRLWENGGNPNWVFTAGPGKRTISSYDGTIVAGATTLTINENAASNSIQRVVNSYITDFGLINVALDRWVPKGGVGTNLNGAIYVLDMPRTQIAILRPVAFERLADDGDRVRGMTLGELSLKVMNEDSHGRLLALSSIA